MLSERNCLLLTKWIFIPIMMMILYVSFAPKSTGKNFQLLGQGVIKNFSMEQRVITFKNGSGAKIADTFHVYSNNRLFDYRVLKPGIKVKVYGLITNNTPVVYKVEASLPVGLIREFDAQ